MIDFNKLPLYKLISENVTKSELHDFCKVLDKFKEIDESSGFSARVNLFTVDVDKSHLTLFYYLNAVAEYVESFKEKFNSDDLTPPIDSLTFRCFYKNLDELKELGNPNMEILPKYALRFALSEKSIFIDNPLYILSKTEINTLKKVILHFYRAIGIVCDFSSLIHFSFDDCKRFDTIFHRTDDGEEILMNLYDTPFDGTHFFSYIDTTCGVRYTKILGTNVLYDEPYKLLFISRKGFKKNTVISNITLDKYFKESIRKSILSHNSTNEFDNETIEIEFKTFDRYNRTPYQKNL